MTKDRQISDLKRSLKEAEEEVDYNVQRKEELKKDLKDADKKIEHLQDELKNSDDMYSHYFQQCCSLSRKIHQLETELESTKDELKECQEGNFYIQQYNNQLVKARDEVDSENEKLKEFIKSLNCEVDKLKNQNKNIVANNLKTLEQLKSDKLCIVSSHTKLQCSSQDRKRIFR